jgi:hypothetical protein
MPTALKTLGRKGIFKNSCEIAASLVHCPAIVRQGFGRRYAESASSMTGRPALPLGSH